MFGGFGPAFFAKYHELQPKSEPVDQYDLRVDLYELYHYLNHALLFGGVRSFCLLSEIAAEFVPRQYRVVTLRVPRRRWTGC